MGPRRGWLRRPCRRHRAQGQLGGRPPSAPCAQGAALAGWTGAFCCAQLAASDPPHTPGPGCCRCAPAQPVGRQTHEPSLLSPWAPSGSAHRDSCHSWRGCCTHRPPPSTAPSAAVSGPRPRPLRRRTPSSPPMSSEPPSGHVLRPSACCLRGRLSSYLRGTPAGHRRPHGLPVRLGSVRHAFATSAVALTRAPSALLLPSLDSPLASLCTRQASRRPRIGVLWCAKGRGGRRPQD